MSPVPENLIGGKVYGMAAAGLPDHLAVLVDIAVGVAAYLLAVPNAVNTIGVRDAGAGLGQ